MDLVYYRGLNCHLSSIITLVNTLGVNYLNAFSTLWSETKFTDEKKYNIYISKRVFTNLKALGIVIKILNCNKMEIEESMRQIQEGELFIIGMDYYNIPWHPVHQHFHGPHYFLAQKKSEDKVVGFDPIYNKKNIEMKSSDILFSIFDLIQVNKINTTLFSASLLDEAKKIARYHPRTIKKILAEIYTCKKEGKNHLDILIKQINAMINNRYLYKHFFNSTAFASTNQEDFFNDIYFLKWEAIRNGLYKAKIIKDNTNVIDEVHDLFNNLMQEEIYISKKIIESIENFDT